MRFIVQFLIAGLILSGTGDAQPRQAPSSTPDHGSFIEELEARTFRFFWDSGDPETGLMPDRAPTRTFASTAAIGYALTAYGIGAERGYVTRDEAAARVLTTLRFLWEAPQGTDPLDATGHRGFFYHFLDLETGRRYRNTELAPLDTALLMAGALFCRETFDAATMRESAIRAYADSLFRRVEWDWAMVRPPYIATGWDPDLGFLPDDHRGYGASVLLYVLALGSPTYPIDATAWDALSHTFDWANFYGEACVQASALAAHQVPHIWIDFRGIQDGFMQARGIDYFESSRRAVLAQRRYAIANPGSWRNYGHATWGLSACDGPADVEREVGGVVRRFRTYWSRGASTLGVRDDGTLAPTAVAGSVPLAPEVVIPALVAMRDRYGDALFGVYGFLDAYNPTFVFADVELRHGRVVPELGWFDTDYLGIDQGPIVAMLENHRSGIVWETMKRNPHVVRGLKRAGFTGGWIEAKPDAEPMVPRSLDRTSPAENEGTRPIVVLGSSTAEGIGPKNAANAWVNRYRAYVRSVDPSLRVVNLARGGYTTYHILPSGWPAPPARPEPDTLRNITRALGRRPAAIVICLPSNDTAYGFSACEQLRNYEIILTEAERAGVPVWITTTLPRNLSLPERRELMAMRDSTLARYGARAIDIWTGIALDDGRLDPEHDSGDHLHLDGDAHGILFERVRQAGVLEAIAAAPGVR